MLYFIYTFFIILYEDRANIWKSCKRLHRIWKINRISNKINDIMYLSHKNSMCPSKNAHLGKEFCDYDECSINKLTKVTKYISRAVYSIDCAIYCINSYSMCKALCDARKRGVIVRIITEKNQSVQINKLFNELALQDLPIIISRTGHDRMMHHKFCIIDGFRRSRELRKADDKRRPTTIAMSGSFNWIGFQRNYDEVLISSNVILVNKFECEFLRMWKSIQLNRL